MFFNILEDDKTMENLKENDLKRTEKITFEQKCEGDEDDRHKDT